MFGTALIFTAVFVLGVLSVAALVVSWFITKTYGQHAGAGEGTMSVGELEERIKAEVEALVETTRPISPERPFPRSPVRLRDPAASVWTLPELVAA
ncbi:hypothetical protein SAMN05216553_118162 [Lentzea fradiae]|uniref:Uncharacterized protein n=1 Tax=Lentzea fradiae TaxID=200378 RepID=A0A1G8AX33_9PSEU|nr:hypothetical protein [Lentzea fradiae]SDH25427.1 hypothetical protein SAMN05216553_118162 [Lentzea fradiae]